MNIASTGSTAPFIVIETETCNQMLERARQAARTEVLCYDGSMKGLLNVLYQTPWGQTRRAGEDPPDAKYVIDDCCPLCGVASGSGSSPR